MVSGCMPTMLNSMRSLRVTLLVLAASILLCAIGYHLGNAMTESMDTFFEQRYAAAMENMQ
jgi:hypothetical protein